MQEHIANHEDNSITPLPPQINPIPRKGTGEGSAKQIKFQILSCKSEEMANFPLRQLGKNEKIFSLWGQNSLGKMAQYNRNSLEKVTYVLEESL